jgi:2-oxoisovalerate dehydrogenase E1 component
MISHLGPQLSVADGIALASKLQKSQKATLTFTGEGGTSEGEFHEALNLAAVWDLPVIFLIENNGYALSTPVAEQYRCASLADRAPGYGMEGMTIDGNNITEVYRTVRNAREKVVREQRPVLIECMTFRMRGHEEASGVKYVPPELFEAWREKDPVTSFESFLVKENIVSDSTIDELKSSLKQEIDEAVKAASHAAALVVDTATELRDVYAPAPSAHIASRDTGPEIRFVDAISQGLRQAMQKHANLILMGQDIAGYGGAFKITEGLAGEFGKDRVCNTPLCESTVLGAALGLSLEGFKAMVEMQFADFVTCGFNQIINNLAKIHYRWGASADVVIRMPTGAGVHAGPFHSQSNEAWFVHTPGLKVVYPSTPYDAKGLLLAAIEDPNPVLFFEHKALYRSITGPVPEDYYHLALGVSRKVMEGSDVSIITYGMGVEWALEYIRNHPDVSVDLVDLRTLSPLDYEGIAATVRRTGKVLVLHEDTLTGGIGGEIAAWIGEHCFQWLDAPVVRCASLDTPVPFAKELEENFLGKNSLRAAIERLISY